LEESTTVPKHITRSELKKDEILDTVTHGAEAVRSHQRQAWIYGVVALLIVASVLGWRFYTQRQTVKASADLADAMRIYQARIRLPSEPADPGELTYVDEKNKFSDAAKKFSEVTGNYSRTQPGQIARYYTALSLAGAEKYDEAVTDFQALASGKDEGFAALARFQLAQIYDKTGKSAQAVMLYQQLIDKPTVFVPKVVAMLAMADHYAPSDPAQATKLYKQIKTDFPDTQAAQEADQRLQLLPSKS
jgi:hypothetical protein